MFVKTTNFISFFIVNMQKGKHIRKAQSMSNPIKKKIVKITNETVILWPKQKELIITIDQES